MKILVVQGDLLTQPVEAIVNPWNRNFLSWWLLLPQGVSGAIKRKAGTLPFKELARAGLLPLGGAVATSAGKLPYKAIIHVAGINLLWQATEWSIRESVRNSLKLASEKHFRSLAMPLIGAGTGGHNAGNVSHWIQDELSRLTFGGEVRVVEFKAPAGIK